LGLGECFVHLGGKSEEARFYEKKILEEDPKRETGKGGSGHEKDFGGEGYYFNREEK